MFKNAKKRAVSGGEKSASKMKVSKDNLLAAEEPGHGDWIMDHGDGVYIVGEDGTRLLVRCPRSARGGSRRNDGCTMALTVHRPNVV